MSHAQERTIRPELHCTINGRTAICDGRQLAASSDGVDLGEYVRCRVCDILSAHLRQQRKPTQPETP